MAAEGKMDLDALLSLLNRGPGTDKFAPPTAKEAETLARMLQEKPDLIAKLADAITSGSLDGPQPLPSEWRRKYTCGNRKTKAKYQEGRC